MSDRATSDLLSQLEELAVRITGLVDDLAESLDDVTTWLEGTEAFEQNHGAHSAAVEARKLLARVRVQR